MRNTRRLPRNLVSIFQMENVSPGKIKSLNIVDAIQPIFKFPPNWSHCGWSSNSCNRWPWKCRPWWNLKKKIIFETRIFLKTSQRPISLTVTGSHKFKRVSEFGIITANKSRRCFPKFCFVSAIFRLNGKQKVLWISEIAQSFQNYFTD